MNTGIELVRKNKNNENILGGITGTVEGLLRHGIPERNDTKPTIEEILTLEKFQDFISEPYTELSFGEYLRADSKKERHFTEKLLQNEFEEENLNIQSNRILIQNIAILSTQQLNYRVYLYGTDDFRNADPNKTKIIDYVDVDLTKYGVQYGNTGLWMYPITDLNILYVDMNRSNKLHIAIENLSESPKLSYGDTVLLVNVMYEPVKIK